MAITKVVVNDKIETLLNDEWDFSWVQIRTATVFREDGVDVSRTFHRHVVMPDADLAPEGPDVQAICNVVFTPECKANYQAYLDAQSNL